MRAPRLRTAAALTLLLLACNSGGDDNDMVPAPAFAIACGGAVPAGADQVALDCPASAAGLIAVDIVIGGPTTSSDIFGIGFDLVFDDAVAAFETAVEGPFLGKDGEATSLLANPDPADPGRLIVALTRLGPVGGVGAAAGTETVVTILLRAVAPGMTALTFENASVIDPSLAPLPLTFTAPLALTVS